jgi:hypothetical protein
MTTPRNPEDLQLPLDVYAPRLDGEESTLPVPYGAGIIGIPDGEELALYYQAREQHSHTWADQLQMAAQHYMDGEEPMLRVSAGLMHHVGGYDPRDGTVDVDPSWGARNLARSWLGSRRRHLTEEVYTTLFPEHPARRVVLSAARDGKVPESVKAFAERNGHDVLIDPLAAAAAASQRPDGEESPARAGDEARTRILEAEEMAAFLEGLPGAKRNVEHVEVRDEGDRITHYRLRYGNGAIGPWQYVPREQPARPPREEEEPAPTPYDELGFKPRKKEGALTGSRGGNFRRSSLRRS